MSRCGGFKPRWGKTDWSLKSCRKAEFLIFAKAQYISTAVKVSVCLLPCAGVTSSVIESKERHVSSGLMRKTDGDGGQMRKRGRGVIAYFIPGNVFK